MLLLLLPSTHRHCCCRLPHTATAAAVFCVPPLLLLSSTCCHRCCCLPRAATATAVFHALLLSSAYCCLPHTATAAGFRALPLPLSSTHHYHCCPPCATTQQWHTGQQQQQQLLLCGSWLSSWLVTIGHHGQLSLPYCRGHCGHVVSCCGCRCHSCHCHIVVVIVAMLSVVVAVVVTVITAGLSWSSQPLPQPSLLQSLWHHCCSHHGHIVTVVGGQSSWSAMVIAAIIMLCVIGTLPQPHMLCELSILLKRSKSAYLPRRCCCRAVLGG